MRSNIDTSSISPGRKAFEWEHFCLILDNCRRRHDRNYNPMEVSDEQQNKDWAMFEQYYAQKFPNLIN